MHGIKGCESYLHLQHNLPTPAVFACRMATRRFFSTRSADISQIKKIVEVFGEYYVRHRRLMTVGATMVVGGAVLNQTLTGFQFQWQAEGIKADVAALKTDVVALKTVAATLKAEVADLRVLMDVVIRKLDKALED